MTREKASRRPGASGRPGMVVTSVRCWPGWLVATSPRSKRSTTASPARASAWPAASRFEAGRGSGTAWVMMLAHRRAVDRVRSRQASAQREIRASSPDIDYDVVAETVEGRLDAERVRKCLGGLTELQRESITLAYYGGYTYREVAGLLEVAVGTVKTRMRDGLIRLRDCLGVDGLRSAGPIRTPCSARTRSTLSPEPTGPGSRGTWECASPAARRPGACRRPRDGWGAPRSLSRRTG